MKTLSLKILVLIALTGILASCGGGSSPAPLIYINAEEYVKSEGFVGTILVKKGDNYLLQKGFGYSNKNQQIQNNISTRYRIGSLTKAFTALAIVQLKNANLISSYDDPLSLYIPDYPRGDEISLRHLLTHRSGIPDYLLSVNTSLSHTPSELIALVKNAELYFEPGTKFSYSNSNYVLLGYLIELLTGQDYESYLQANIWSSLGMINTEYGESVISNTPYALGYKDSQQTQLADFHDMSIPFAAGALSSDIADMELWAESFFNDLLLSEQDKQEIFSGAYGFGWEITRTSGKLAYRHTGGIDGFSSIITLFPEDNSLIIALSNVEREGEKLIRISSKIAEEEF